MTIDVFTPYEKGRWHLQIIGPLDKSADAASPLASCCDDRGGSCVGFRTEQEAQNAGWEYAKAHRMC